MASVPETTDRPHLFTRGDMWIAYGWGFGMGAVSGWLGIFPAGWMR